MKNKCLDDFYKSLEDRTNGEYVNSLRELIDNKGLKVESLTELINEEVGR